MKRKSSTKTANKSSRAMCSTAGPAAKVTEEMRFELSEQVRKRPDRRVCGNPAGHRQDAIPAKIQPKVKFYAENAAVSEERGWLQGKINDIVRTRRLEEAKIDPDLVEPSRQSW